MAGGGGGNAGRELDQTPTWALAAVCFIIIIISIVLEKFFHHKKKVGLLEALEKVKGELMVLGFISLLLTFGQKYISQVCIPIEAADTMLPCPYRDPDEEAGGGGGGGDHRRRLLWYERRYLAGGSAGPGCKAGKVPLISLNGLHQLHIFIFFLAIFHVVYGALTMTLGRLKIRAWKVWEREMENDNEFNDPTKFRLTHETSFVRDHTKCWTKTPFTFYLVSFFRQFFRSVRRADYLTMRHGFIAVHLAPGRWEAMFVLSILPLIIILAVGTKLQAIITQMALEIQERHAVVQGIPLVQVSDEHFWFGWPQLVLHLIHFVLFQNAFEITYFFWIWYEFGLRSCFHDNFVLTALRVALGVAVQFMCSYITLPLYALVTQMGSTMKKSIFDEQTNKALKIWQKNAAAKKAGGKSVGKASSGGDSVTKPPPKAKMDKNASTPEQTANITASVDIQGNNTDLLSGP
ncbi:hypothetical protein C1H46_040799 [Malus baccata]|uniref:MLO-like protein n=1 Tax=Malus baccata TaxID=106549 RepID=A0A540KHH3_MALBA|nr:hypothetical protein C1H46_040799 [Malus baccata]